MLAAHRLARVGSRASAGRAATGAVLMSPSTDPASGTGDATWLRREAVIGRFETAWQENGQADLAQFLSLAGPDQRALLLLELVKIDLENRWNRGQATHVEDYARTFPELLRE